MLNWIVWNRTVYMYKNGFGVNNIQWLNYHKPNQTRIKTHILTQTNLQTQTQTHAHANTLINTRTNIYIHTHRCIHTHIHTFKHIDIWVHTCIYIYIYIYAHAHIKKNPLFFIVCCWNCVLWIESSSCFTFNLWRSLEYADTIPCGRVSTPPLWTKKKMML